MSAKTATVDAWEGLFGELDDVMDGENVDFDPENHRRVLLKLAQRRRVARAKERGQCVRCSDKLDPRSKVHCTRHMAYNRNKVNAFRDARREERDAKKKFLESRPMILPG